MNGIEYTLLVFGTMFLILAVAADAWNKRNKK